MFTTNSPPMYNSYQLQCYNDNDCRSESANGVNLRCRRFPMGTEEICLDVDEDLPSWFTLRSPLTTPTSTIPTSTTTPTYPAHWRCGKLYEICADDTNCLCKHSNELRCTYVPDMKVNQCIWDQITGTKPYALEMNNGLEQSEQLYCE